MSAGRAVILKTGFVRVPENAGVAPGGGGSSAIDVSRSRGVFMAVAPNPGNVSVRTDGWAAAATSTSTRVRLTHVPATPLASRRVTADIFVSALRASPGKTVWLKLGPASQMGLHAGMEGHVWTTMAFLAMPHAGVLMVSQVTTVK